MASDLQNSIKVQGDLIRSMKQENAPKEKVINYSCFFCQTVVLCAQLNASSSDDAITFARNSSCINISMLLIDIMYHIYANHLDASDHNL